METTKQQKAHIVLVHGACHGAWTWYKLKPLLEGCGLRVTAIDLCASGIDSRSLHDVRKFEDYSLPLLELMASIPPDEKVVLLGHSLGGMSVGLAMEKFPEKISAAIFLSAFMPGSNDHGPSFIVDEYCSRIAPEDWQDCVFAPIGTPEEPFTSILFGHEFFKSKLYQLCPPEDVELAKMLLRPSSLFQDDLYKLSPFSDERFGSVKRVYIVLTKDKGIQPSYQRWLIDTIGVDEVREIEADHQVNISKPQELCECLVEIATKYN